MSHIFFSCQMQTLTHNYLLFGSDIEIENVLCITAAKGIRLFLILQVKLQFIGRKY